MLYFHALVEPEVGQRDAEPADETRGGGEVGEPGEDDAGAGAEGHVCEEGKA